MKINTEDILRVKPSKALVMVAEVLTKVHESDLVWLKNYWKTKYGIKLPKNFQVVAIVFPTSSKVYKYPVFKKCCRKILFQKRAKRLFQEEKNFVQLKRSSLLKLRRKIQEIDIFDEFIRDPMEEGLSDDF